MSLTLSEGRNGVLTIRLNTPGALNVLSLAQAAALQAALDEAADPGIRCVVLTGAGRAFCAGGDLREVAALPPGAGRDYMRRIHESLTAMRVLRKPVIAAVNGAAVGAGLSLALAADMAVACESAHFQTAFAGVGAVPDLNLVHRLPRVVGRMRAADLILTNPRLTAAEALTLGLVSRVWPDADFSGAVADLAADLAAGPTSMFATLREMLDQAETTGFDDMLRAEATAQALAFASDDFREGAAAFLTRRQAEFPGR